MNNEKPLKTALLANAIFSTASGVLFVTAASSVADLVGLGDPLLYRVLGAGLLAFAALVAWTATRTNIDPLLARSISFGDFGWVAGTVVVILIFLGDLKPAGIAAMLIVALVVLAFGLSQMRGLRRLDLGSDG